MVIKTFCDKCGKEIKNNEHDELFKEALVNFFEEENNIPKLDEIYLCSKCEKGYNKIIKETIKKIKEYLNS